MIKIVLWNVFLFVVSLIVLFGVSFALAVENYSAVGAIIGGLIVYFLGRSLRRDETFNKK